MSVKNILFAFIFSLTYFIQTLCQSLSFQSLNGPYGGSLGDIVSSSNRDIYVTAYGWSYNSNGIYKSTDEGNSWQKLPFIPSIYYTEFYALGINSQDHLFVGTNGAGLFRSTDHGLTWEAINNGYSSSEGWAFEFNDNGHIFAGAGDFWGLYKSTNNGNSWKFLQRYGTLSLAIDSLGGIYAGTWDSLYKSNDNGESWRTITNGLPVLPISAITINSKNEIFIGTGYRFSGDGVYYSNDGGENWIPRGLQGKVVYSLTIHSSGILFAGTQQDGVYRSTDDRITWQQINVGLINKNIFRVKMTSFNILFAASESDGGIFRSTDLGDSWKNTGVPIGSVSNGVFDSANNIYTSTHGGVQKYTSSNKTWTNLGPPRVRNIVFDDDNYLFAGTYRNGVFKSNDFGITWDTTASLGGPNYNILTMAKYPDGSILLGTNDYIKRTTDKGVTWSTISNGLTNWISNLSVSPEGFIYAVANNKLYRANIIDSSFINIKDSIGAEYSYSVLAAGNNGLVYYVKEGSNGGIFRSVDYGNSWVKLSDSSANSIRIFNNYVCVGLTINGILLSSDQGENWIKVVNGLPLDGQVYSSFFDSSGYLYCGVGNLGLFKSNTIVTYIEEIKFSPLSTFNLSQNYPNPFNPSTKIKWQSPVSGWQTLKVYDVLGNEVATLINEYKPAGSYEVEFEALSGIRHLVSGIYFYQLIVGNYSDTKKMLLLK